jgi:hypothetical protein
LEFSADVMAERSKRQKGQKNLTIKNVLIFDVGGICGLRISCFSSGFSLKMSFSSQAK